MGIIVELGVITYFRAYQGVARNLRFGRKGIVVLESSNGEWQTTEGLCVVSLGGLNGETDNLCNLSIISPAGVSSIRIEESRIDFL